LAQEVNEAEAYLRERNLWIAHRHYSIIPIQMMGIRPTPMLWMYRKEGELGDMVKEGKAKKPWATGSN
jgi:hypothetical protein